MNTIESVRSFCKSLPYTTEDIKWEHNLVFSVGRKMYAVMGLDADPEGVSFKCTPEEFDRLIQMPNIIPAPYLARYSWVKLERLDELEEALLKEYLQYSYELVFAKLHKKVREMLSE